MRLGGQECVLVDGSVAAKCYGKTHIIERHRHRYEVNNNYLDKLEAAGLKIVGRSHDGELVEVIEVGDHPWFVACQFHPNSPPRRVTATVCSRATWKRPWRRTGRRPPSEGVEHAEHHHRAG